MAKLVWVRREDGFGEDPEDLELCSRFFLQTDPDEFPEERATFHLSPRGRWFEAQVTGLDGKGDAIEEFRETHPIEVAFHVLRFRYKLPRELAALPENDRAIASDWNRFREWRSKRAGVAPPPRPKPHWDAVARTLTFDGKLCHRYETRAKNQFEVLDAFQAAGWGAVDNPFKGSNSESTFKDTIKGLRVSVGTEILWFGQDNQRAVWKVARQGREEFR